MASRNPFEQGARFASRVEAGDDDAVTVVVKYGRSERLPAGDIIKGVVTNHSDMAQAGRHCRVQRFDGVWVGLCYGWSLGRPRLGGVCESDPLVHGSTQCDDRKGHGQGCQHQSEHIHPLRLTIPLPFPGQKVGSEKLPRGLSKPSTLFHQHVIDIRRCTTDATNGRHGRSNGRHHHSLSLYKTAVTACCLTTTDGIRWKRPNASASPVGGVRAPLCLWHVNR